MMATLSFLGAYWHWVTLALLAAAGIGYLAFIGKNLKLAIASGLVVFAVFFVAAVDRRAYQRKADEDLKARTAQLEYRLKLQDKILSDYEEMSKRDDAEIAKLREQVAATPENPTACLPEDAAGRIGEIK